MALTANINRDTKRAPKPFEVSDFLLFAQKDDEEVDGFSPEVAAVALELRHEDRCPRLLICCWGEVLQGSKTAAKAPDVRALRSDDEKVWVLCPKWEGRNCRGGLVLVEGCLSGRVQLRDLDRSLNVYELMVPERSGFGWVEEGLLLLAAET